MTDANARRPVLVMAVTCMALVRLASAEGRVVVLGLSTGRDVGPPVADSVRRAIAAATADAGVTAILTTAEDVSGTKNCVRETECLAEVATQALADIVIGCELRTSPSTNAHEFRCEAVRAAGRESLGAVTGFLRAKNLEVDAEATVRHALELALPEADPPPTADPKVAEPEVTPESVPTPARAPSETAREPRVWQVRALAGVLVPRADLDVGGYGTLTVDRALGAGRLRVEAAVDFAHLGQQDQAFTAPPQYPRARADLIQRSVLVGGWAGAHYDLVRLGPASLYGGAGMGLIVHRARFDAFSMSRTERAFAPAATLRLGVRGAAGARMMWIVDLSWREVRHELGDSGDFGEATTSGLVASCGLGVGL